MQGLYRRQGLWLLLPLVLFLGGCASTTERMDDLGDTLRNYKKSIRWAQFEQAYSFRKRQDGSDAMPQQSLENVRVTKYTEGGSQLSADKLHFSQTVRISYYLLDSPREREVTDQQQWVYDSEKGRWELTSELPKF